MLIKAHASAITVGLVAAAAGIYVFLFLEPSLALQLLAGLCG
jgi:hypothetical protein